MLSKAIFLNMKLIAANKYDLVAINLHLQRSLQKIELEWNEKRNNLEIFPS